MEDVFWGGLCLLLVLLWLKDGEVTGGRHSNVTYNRYGQPVRYWMFVTGGCGCAVYFFVSAFADSRAMPVVEEAPASPAREEAVLAQRLPETPRASVASAPEPNWSGRGAPAAALLRSDQPAEALKLYDELLSETEADADLHYGRGTALWKLGRTDAALAAFRRTLELQPDHYSAVVSSDRMLEPLARWSEILEMWNRYIAVESGIASAFLERAGTHSHMGNMAGAAADMTKACEMGMSGACPVAERMRANVRP